MAKIKDLVVVDVNYVRNEIDRLQYLHKKTSSKLEKEKILIEVRTLNKLMCNVSPLTPIIRDAWNERDTTLSDYLNEKEI
jgi:hypothetical protein